MSSYYYFHTFHTVNKAELSEVNTHRDTAAVSAVKGLVVTHDFESLTSYR